MSRALGVDLAARSSDRATRSLRAERVATPASECGPSPSGGGRAEDLRVGSRGAAVSMDGLRVENHHLGVATQARVQELCGRDQVHEGSISVCSDWEARSRKTVRTRSRGQGRDRWSGTKAASTRGCVDPEGRIQLRERQQCRATDAAHGQRTSGSESPTSGHATASGLRGWMSTGNAVIFAFGREWSPVQRGRLRAASGHRSGTPARSPSGGERSGTSGTGW
jgi:hypothetical protein